MKEYIYEFQELKVKLKNINDMERLLDLMIDGYSAFCGYGLSDVKDIFESDGYECELIEEENE